MREQFLSQIINNPALSGPIKDISTGSEFIQKFLPVLVGAGFVLGTIIFFFSLTIGAVSWITSAGNKAALEIAQSRVTKAIVGIFILFSFFGIANLIGCVFKVNFLEIKVGTASIGFSQNPLCKK